MPRCSNAECARTTKRERKFSRILYRHCRPAQNIYEAVRPSLAAGDYHTARHTAARHQQPCHRCGITPQFVLTFPAQETDPSGFSLLEVQGMFTHPHPAPAAYPRCRPDTIHIPALVELEQEPYVHRGMADPNPLFAIFVGAPAHDPAYGQQDPSGMLFPSLPCIASIHAQCDRAQELKALIAETPNPDQAAAVLNDQPPLRLPDGHVANFRLAMLTTASGLSSYQIVEYSPNRQNYFHSDCEKPKLTA